MSSGMGTEMSTETGAERVGMVLAGAAARGPYQAGALSVLDPPSRRESRHEP